MSLDVYIKRKRDAQELRDRRSLLQKFKVLQTDLDNILYDFPEYTQDSEDVKAVGNHIACIITDLFDGDYITEDSLNITHNLSKMAFNVSENFYKALWRPHELLGFEEGADVPSESLIPILENGLSDLKSNPGKYKAFNPENGWGSYEILVSFVERYLAMLNRYTSKGYVVNVSR